MDDKFKDTDDPQSDEQPTVDDSAKPHEVEFSNDSEIDKVVDQIVNEDSDKLLAVEDVVRDKQFNDVNKKKGFLSKIKGIFYAWWVHKKLRYGTLIGLALLLIIGMFVPPTRYAMLNIVGVRVRASMTIVDSETGLPLENIPVNLQNKEQRSDENGNVYFTDLKQGNSDLVVNKKGYALYEKKIVLGWGSNPIGEQPIVATGAQYRFVLKDWLSDKILVDEATATSGEDVAKADEAGEITLTVGESSDETKAVLSAKGYRSEEIQLSDINVETYEVKMVPQKQHVFVSNRNGDYDIYKIDVDTLNEEILMASTGKEREVPFIVPHQTQDYVAIISSRDGDLNKDNYPLDGLFVVNVTSGDSYKVTRSEQIQVVGWSDNKLIYVAVVEGVSAGNSQRSRIVSYDLETKQRTDLAASNYFNDVKLINDTVYYSVSSYGVPQSQAKLFSVDPNGNDKKVLVDQQVWSIFRKDYNTILFSAEDQSWFQQVLGEEVVEKLESQPTLRSGRQYVISPDKKTAVWVDIRDGKGVLLKYDIESKSETTLLTEAGLDYPVYWLADNYLVYRIETNEVSSDFVLNIDGGESQKIADVVGNRSRYFY